MEVREQEKVPRRTRRQRERMTQIFTSLAYFVPYAADPEKISPDSQPQRKHLFASFQAYKIPLASGIEHGTLILAMDPKDLSSNWKRLQATLTSTRTGPLQQDRPKKRKRAAEPTTSYARKASRMDKEERPSEAARKFVHAPDKVNSGLSSTTEIGRYVAMDCEMVGVGPNPDKESALARVSIVNFNGDQIYDTYVRPKEEVTDWRTAVSGILPKHMFEARSLEDVQADVTKILENRVLVGHAIRNDLDALLLSHPKRDIRDTARYAPYRKLAGGGSPRLKILASELLGLEIQMGEHSSIEDARACMLLFRRDKDAFEREHAKKWPTQTPRPTEPSSQNQKSRKKKKKKK